MISGIIRKNPLFYSFFFPAVIDGFLTLVGQDSSYWINNTVNEASPAYYFLLFSPWMFFLGTIIWFIFWYWLFKKIKEPFNLFFVFIFISGHSWGSSSWLWKIMKSSGFYELGNQPSIIFSWLLNVLYFSLIALFATYCLRIYIKTKK